VIDPAPAVARQVGRLLEARGLHDLDTHWKRDLLGARPSQRFLTTGDPQRLAEMLPQLLGEDAPEVQALHWDGDQLT
jgi:hypothetical protein